MNLVAICSYDDYITAHIIMGRLEEENINCYLFNEHTVTTGPFLSNMIGGIRLMVPETQAERARGLLQQFEQKANT